MNLIPPKVCAYCREPFTPKQPKQRHCNTRCARKRVGERMRGQPLIAALRAKQAKKIARAHEAIQALTDPIAIYERGRRDGYMEGYNAAYYKLGRRRTEAA